MVPGSLGKKQDSYAAIGGVLGALAGAVAPMWAGGSWAANTGTAMAVAAAASAIVVALLARSLASPERAETGRVRTGAQDSETYFDPSRRDPRLGAADAATAGLPRPQRQGFL